MSRCFRCGYDLMGRVVGERCPECGGSIIESPLRGGLASGGVRFARPAAWLSIGIVACACAVASSRLLVQIDASRLRDGDWFATVVRQAFCLQLFLGAAQCVLIARMVPASSRWMSIMWVAGGLRALLGIACETAYFDLMPNISALLVTGRAAALALVFDLVTALAVQRSIRTGGLSSRATVPALVAVVAAFYGLTATRWAVLGPEWVFRPIVSGGVMGAVACAIAFRMIAREIDDAMRD